MRRYDALEFCADQGKKGLLEKVESHLHLLMHKMAPKFAIFKFVVIFMASKKRELRGINVLIFFQ